jgi:hypothetical protein
MAERVFAVIAAAVAQRGRTLSHQACYGMVGVTMFFTPIA